MVTTSRDLMANYGDGCDFDRLLAGRRTIATCWMLAVLLILATGVPVAVEATHALARGIAPHAEQLTQLLSPTAAPRCADPLPGEG